MITQEIKLYKEPEPIKPVTVTLTQDDVDKAVVQCLTAGIFPGNVYRTKWNSLIEVVEILATVQGITNYRGKPTIVNCKVETTQGYKYDSKYTVEEITGDQVNSYSTTEPWELIKSGSLITSESK